MSPRKNVARERQRLDALIARPLRAFRAEVARMSNHDLALLEARLEARLVGATFSRGVRGMARHLAAQELPLLERRLALVQARLTAPRPAQLRLVEPAGDPGATPVMLPDEPERLAA